MKVLVTGGSGFIGSHLVSRLLELGDEVIVYDKLSTGRIGFIVQHLNNPKFRLVIADVLDLDRLKDEMIYVDMVYHFQANADVRGGIKNNYKDIEQNILCTYNVLEAMRCNNVKKIVFASSAAVYGEPEIIPTPETYVSIQTSLYGSSKISCEAMIQAFSEYYEIYYYIFRFTSFIGENYTHGVIVDFVNKLLLDSGVLDILGDGNQKKSYLYVEDGIDTIFNIIYNSCGGIFNLGHDCYISVRQVADIVVEEMGLKKVHYLYTGGRSWLGDSDFVWLDTTKAKRYGWGPKVTIEEGIRRTVKYLLKRS